MRKRGATGFTLIELLTVIAIISILAAITFIVGSRMIMKAKMASVGTDFRNLHTQLFRYYTGHTESYPPAYGYLKDAARDKTVGQLVADQAIADAGTEEEAFLSWESVKREEKWTENNRSILDGIPRTLPALTKARRIQERVSAVGFDWKETGGALRKLDEEMEEFKTALEEQSSAHTQDEIGDVLFSLVNVARLLGQDPEAALERTNAKFRRRFSKIEKHMVKSSGPLSLEEMDKLWEEVKRKEE